MCMGRDSSSVGVMRDGMLRPAVGHLHEVAWGCMGVAWGRMELHGEVGWWMGRVK